MVETVELEDGMLLVTVAKDDGLAIAKDDVLAEEETLDGYCSTPTMCCVVLCYVCVCGCAGGGVCGVCVWGEGG